MRSFYERLGFNDRQIEIIAHADPSATITASLRRGRLFDMALGPLTLLFTGVSDRRQITEIQISYKITCRLAPGMALAERRSKCAPSP